MAGLWDIVVPEQTVNKVLNPTGSGGLTTSIAVSNAVASLNTNLAYFAPNSILVTMDADNDSVRYSLSALANATHYVSLRIQGTLPAAWDWSLNGSDFHGPTLIATEGDWLFYGLQFGAAEASGSTLLYINQNGAGGTVNFTIGHVQVEEKAYATTPVTGDLGKGYYWNGTPGNSASTREAWIRSGGRVYDLDDQYGYYLSNFVDIGAPELERYETEMSLMPGSLDDGHKIFPRLFTLIGEQAGTTYAGMHLKRKELLSVIMPDYVKDDQPVTLRYRGANASHPVQIHAHYSDGFKFGDVEGFVSRSSLVLHANDPYFYDLYETITQMTTTQTLSVSGGLKNTAGVFSTISGTDFDEVARVIVPEPVSGRIYFFGGFENAGGTSAPGACYLESTGFAAMGTGTTDVIYDAVNLPNGDVWVCGTFPTIDGDNTDGLAMWDYSSTDWVPYDLSAGADIRALAVGKNNHYVYFGGSFTNWNAIAAADFLCAHNGDTFTALGTVPFTSTDFPNALDTFGDNLYIGTADVGSASKLILWDGTNYTTLVTTNGSSIGSVRCAPNGDVYVVHNGTTANGVSAPGIFRYSGGNVFPLGSGISGFGQRLRFDSNGFLVVSGSTTDSGGISTTGQSRWNGSSWVYVPFRFDSNFGYDFAERNGIEYFISLCLTAVTSVVNSVTNSGTAKVFPRFVVKRVGGTSATVKYLENITTGRRVWLNYALQDGEQLTLDFNPQDQACISSYWGERWDAVLRGSDIADFYLLPGVNSIGAFVDSTTDTTMTSYLAWRNAYISADGGAT